MNVKEIELLEGGSDILVKKIKPNFKTLGPKYGRLMKDISNVVSKLNAEDIKKLEQTGNIELVGRYGTRNRDGHEFLKVEKYQLKD